VTTATTWPGFAHAPVPAPKRWTREDFAAISDTGVFGDDHVELIDGEILLMPKQGEPYVASIVLVGDALRAVFGKGYVVRCQAPLNLGKHDEPQPDYSIVRGSPRDFKETPTTALLVVEISDSTLSHDRNRKAGLYARAGIADYWVVDLRHRRVEVRRGPVADRRAPFGHKYSAVSTHRIGKSIAPLAAEGSPIAVADLIP
jgi:Uma2 family endonuclease